MSVPADAGGVLLPLAREAITARLEGRAERPVVDEPAWLAAPGAGGRTVSSYLDRSGRLEIIWFPFTPTPWLKVWTISPLPPLGSIPVLSPYNYTFADGLFGFLLDPGSLDR